jgi:hypothetical protein
MTTNGTTPADTTIEYGDVKRDLAALPTTTVVALARRGLAHLLGNEAASKVSGAVDKEAGVAEADDVAAKTAKRTAWKKANEAAFATLVASVRADLLTALDAGTLGASTRGPRGSSADTIAREIAEDEIMAILKQHGIARPKKAADKVNIPDGSEFTMGELIARRLSDTALYGHGTRIRKAAEAKLAALAKVAEKATAEGAIGL